MRQIVKVTVLLISLFQISLSHASIKIQTWTTSKGANVFYVPIERLPMVDIKVVFAAGSVRDGQLYGLANITNALLDTAAAGKDAQTIAQQLEDVGARISNGSLREMAWYQIRTLSYPEQMKVATTLLTEAINQPDFDEGEYKRIKQSMFIGLKESKQSPSSQGKKAFFKTLYQNHVYGHPPEGTEASLKAITLKDVKAFYKQYYVSKNATIVIVGDVKRNKAEQLAEQLVAKLPTGKRAKAIKTVDPLAMASTQYIDFPTKQSHVFIGQLGVKRTDPDYFTLYVANHILGGSGFTSRIVDEVREKRGLAYSAYSYFLPMEQQGPFLMGLQTKNNQVEQAINVIMDTLTVFIEDGPKQKELNDALSNITGSAALRTDSNKKIAQYVAMIGFYGLPLNYLDTLNENFKKVTVAKIKSTMKRRINPQKMVTVVVGKQTQ